jgi:hypothetical protein
VNSADQPPAVVSVRARTKPDPAAPAGPPGSVTGPVAPTATASGTHQPLTRASLDSGLLHQWQQRNLAASLPLALRQLEDAGNLDNVRLAIQADRKNAAAEGEATSTADGYGAPGGHRPVGVGPVDPLPGTGYRGPVFMDSDIYKTMEAVGWELAHGDRPELTSFASEVIALLERAQRPDGYLNSYFQVSGEPRYTRLAWSHEMYCAGHLIQAAVALHRGAGDGRLLAIAVRLADHLVREFAGTGRGLDGHPIIETTLAELYRDTGTEAYLDLARQFVDQRGRGLAGNSGMGRRYLQDHLPVRATDTEVGHVVRALYLEAGVTDVAAETGDRELLESSRRRWDDMVAAKTYLTGGNGSRHADEGFGDRFELPQDRAYNETCAAIASFQWCWRLLLATGDAKVRGPHGTRALQRLRVGDRHRGPAVLLRQPAAAPRGPLREGRPRPAPGVVQLRLLPAEHHAPHRIPGALPRHRIRRHAVRPPVHRVPAVRGGPGPRGHHRFEQADQLDGAPLDDLVIEPGGVLGERPVALDGIGQTIEITVPAGPQTAIAIPYFQWDNRDGRPMRVWMPRS